MAVSDDVVRQILVRVKDVTTLFRCATVCKGWRGLFVADDSFLRRCLPEDNPIAGFLTQHTHQAGGVHGPCFVPATLPVFGTRCRFICPFLPVPTYRPFCTTDMAPLASRQHLLLARIGGQLAMCDLLAGTLNMLPSLEDYWGSDGYMTGYAVLTATDDCWSSEDKDRSPSSYKVLIIAIEKDTMQHSLHMFSSATGGSSRWDMSIGRLGEYRSICSTLTQGNAVVRRGMAHWLFRDTTGFYTIDVCAKTSHVSITELPDVRFFEFYIEPYLSVDAEERFNVLLLKMDGSVLCTKIWNHDRTLTDARIVALGTPFRQTKEIDGMTYTLLGEKNGMLLIKDNNERVYVVGVETRWWLQELTNLSCTRGGVGRENVVPLELNWPAFFVSRLLGEVTV
ncbi:unnamed protein product [Alopecurus aequalis]